MILLQKLNPTIIPSEDTLVAIFNEIRDAQSGKKNASVVEGVTLVAPDEALNYGRHLFQRKKEKTYWKTAS